MHVLLLAVCLAGLLPEPAVGQEQAYTQRIETWRQEREARLRSETGWLTIAGLHWLQTGDNRVGSAADNDIVLPADAAPAHVGVFRLEHGTTTFRAEPGVAVWQHGEKVHTASLGVGTASDALRIGRLSLWVHTSGQRFALRLRDPDHPLRKTFTGLRWFPIEAAYRVEARFEPYERPKSVTMLNILGDLERFQSPGQVVFELRGQTVRLEPVVGGADNLFFVFRDATSGRETYGAARFLHAPLPRNGRLSPGFQHRLQPAVRLQSLHHLSAADPAEPARAAD